MTDEGPQQTCSSTCPCETNPHRGQEPEIIGEHIKEGCKTSEVV